MPQQVHGVIARSQGSPVELVEITVPDPGPGEAVVRVQACGVCHTDLPPRSTERPSPRQRGCSAAA